MTTPQRPAPRRRPRTAASPRSAVSVHPSGVLPGTNPSAADDALEAVRWMLEAPERAHVDEDGTIADNLRSLARQAAGPIVDPAIEVLEGLGTGGGWEPVRPEPAGLWRDLRPSEALELRELIEHHATVAALECQAVITSHLAAAAVIFAEKHPDAPRGRWQDRDYVDERPSDG